MIQGVFLVGVGKVLVAGMLRYIKLVAEKRPHPSKLQDTLASVHHRDLVLGHQLFATMSSDEFRNSKKILPFHLKRELNRELKSLIEHNFIRRRHR